MPQSQAKAKAVKKPKLLATDAFLDAVQPAFGRSVARSLTMSGAINSFFEALGTDENKTCIKEKVTVLPAIDKIDNYIELLASNNGRSDSLQAIRDKYLRNTTTEIFIPMRVYTKYPVKNQFGIKVIQHSTPVVIDGVNYVKEFIVYRPWCFSIIDKYLWYPSYRFLVTDSLAYDSSFESALDREADRLITTPRTGIFSSNHAFNATDGILQGSTPYRGSALAFVAIPEMYSLCYEVNASTNQVTYMERTEYENTLKKVIDVFTTTIYIINRREITIQPKSSEYIFNTSDKNHNMSNFKCGVTLTETSYIGGAGSSNSHDSSDKLELIHKYLMPGVLNGTPKLNAIDMSPAASPSTISASLTHLIGMYLAPRCHIAEYKPNIPARFVGYTYAARYLNLDFENFFGRNVDQSLINSKQVIYSKMDYILSLSSNYERNKIVSAELTWDPRFGFPSPTYLLMPEIFGHAGPAEIPDTNKALESVGFTFNPQLDTSRAFIIIQPNPQKVDATSSKESQQPNDRDGLLKSIVIPLRDSNYEIMFVDNLISPDDKTNRVMTPAFSMLLTEKGTEIVPFADDLKNAIIGQVA